MEKKQKKKITLVQWNTNFQLQSRSLVELTVLQQKNKKTGVALLHKLLAALILLVIRSSCLASTEYIYIYVSLKTIFL